MTQIAQTMTQAAQHPFASMHSLKRSVERYVDYRRTLGELRALPLETLWDLDIDPGALKETAKRAVYAN